MGNAVARIGTTVVPFDPAFRSTISVPVDLHIGFLDSGRYGVIGNCTTKLVNDEHSCPATHGITIQLHSADVFSYAALKLDLSQKAYEIDKPTDLDGPCEGKA